MSIAEKLTTIAENEQRVYNAGFAKGNSEGYDFGFQTGSLAGEEQGKQAERDWFWDTMQQNGNRTDYLYAFAGNIWSDETYDPKHTITPTTNAQLMYAYSRITDTKVDIDMTAATTIYNCAEAFSNAMQLKTIRKLIVDERIPMHNHFTGCTALQNITIEGVIARNVNVSACPLTRASIENVVGALSDTVTGRTATFKTAAVDAAFTAEEWTALTASKPNWTFVKG